MNKAEEFLEKLRTIKVIRDEYQLFRDQKEINELRDAMNEFANIKIIETSNNPDPAEYYYFPDESVFMLENPRQMNYCCYGKVLAKEAIKKYLDYLN